MKNADGRLLRNQKCCKMFAPEQLEEEVFFLPVGGEPVVSEDRKFEENVPQIFNS